VTTEDKTKEPRIDTVEIRIEGAGNTGKTAMATLIEDLLKKNGVTVERILTGEGGEVGVEESAAIVRQVSTPSENLRQVKVRLSERHVGRPFSLMFQAPSELEDPTKALRMEHLLTGYVELWWGGRKVLEFKPTWVNAQGRAVFFYLDEATPEMLDKGYFEVALFGDWPNRTVVGRYPLNGFLDAIEASHFFFLAWMQLVQLEPWNVAFQKTNAIALVARARGLLDLAVQSYKEETSHEAFPQFVRIPESAQMLVQPKTKQVSVLGPQARKIKISIDASDLETSISVHTLVSDLLKRIGIEIASEQFRAPAPLILEMDEHKATELLQKAREAGYSAAIESR